VRNNVRVAADIACAVRQRSTPIDG
jgi:hypothetical protein